MSRIFRMTVQDSVLDIFFYDNGNNLIALKSITKKPQEKWKQWQEEPMPIELYEKQKKNGDFDNGYGIITGKLWRGAYQGKHLVCIDIDNKKGIDTFLSYFSQVKTIDELAKTTLVVQHKDAKEEKVHIYFITENPITKRSGIRRVSKEKDKEVNEDDEIPKIEVKSDSSTYVVGPGSTHKSGHPYEIVGISKPSVLNKEQSEQLENALNDIYERCGNKKKNNQNGLIPISELFKNDFTIFEGNNRQEAVLRTCESLLQRLKGIYPIDKIREMAYEWNKEHCKPPLDDKEFGVKWDNAIKFLEKKSIDEKDEKEEGEDQVRVSVADIIASVKERYIEIFKDQINTFYVTLKINDHVECIPLQSNRFKNVIRKEFFDKIGQLISDDKLDGIIKLIESQSMFDDNIRKIELSLRVAKLNANDYDNDVFYYDLTTTKWEIVKISPDEGRWEIVKDSNLPIFKRHENNCSPQVYPLKEYGKDVFEQFLKLFNFGSRRDILLFSVYLISLFIPNIPKVILVIKGTGGGAKTTAFKMIKDMVDPSTADTLSFPKQINDLIQTLDHHYVNFFDNVSSVSEEVSDMLCRAVTGSGNMKRALFTNDSDFIYKFKRCIGINGINLATTKADFLDRALIIEVKRIEKEKRKKEDELFMEFERLKPFVLGFIFDILVKTLIYRKEHKGEKILKNGYPRMADFAEWSEVISRCLGYQDNEFLNAYYENIYNQNDEIIESSPVAEAIVLYMNELEREYWEGTPTRLYKTLTDVIDQIKPDLKRSNVWPKASNTLTSMINDVAHNLKEKSIEVITGERDSQGNRVIKIRKLRKSINNNNHDYESESENRAKNNNIDYGLLNPHIHRVGSSDNFECDNCPLVEDIHFMKQHMCSGAKKH